MIDALVSGRMRGTVNLRTTKTGTPFALWRMATTDKNGDSIAVSGEAAISTWQGGDGTARHGLDVLVHVVMTAYHLGRKRKASEPTDSDDERGPL